jgi:hypothetical protein
MEKGNVLISGMGASMTRTSSDPNQARAFILGSVPSGSTRCLNANEHNTTPEPEPLASQARRAAVNGEKGEEGRGEEPERERREERLRLLDELVGRLSSGLHGTTEDVILDVLQRPRSEANRKGYLCKS